MGLFYTGRHRQHRTADKHFPSWRVSRTRRTRLGRLSSTLALLAVLGVLAAWLWAGSFRPLVILSGSMAPSLPVGAVALFRPVEPAQLVAGDIIAFTEPDTGRLVAHRIAEIVVGPGKPSYRTKGDANRQADRSPLPHEAIIGAEALTVPHLGYLLLWAREPPGFLVLVLLPGIVLLGGELRGLARALRALRPNWTAR